MRAQNYKMFYQKNWFHAQIPMRKKILISRLNLMASFNNLCSLLKT